MTTGIQLVLGKDVRIDSYGLEARIEGNVAAYVAPDEVSTATGELRIAEGASTPRTRASSTSSVAVSSSAAG